MNNLEHYYPIGAAVTQIRQIIEQSRSQVAQSVNAALLRTYWEIGRVIVDTEQHGQARADYGKGLLLALARQLTKDLGKGFSRSNLQSMHNFYLTYPNCQTVSGNFKMK